jgi:hypothetical protein
LSIRGKDILGAPVLLLPARRELMYNTLDKAKLSSFRQNWLENNAKPANDWKLKASNVDPALKRIIDGQDFSVDFKGALHFARVVAAHYGQNCRKTVKIDTTPDPHCYFLYALLLVTPYLVFIFMDI